MRKGWKNKVEGWKTDVPNANYVLYTWNILEQYLKVQ